MSPANPDGFVQYLGDACSFNFFFVIVSEGGLCKNGNVVPDFFDGPGGFQSIHDGHLYVHQYEINLIIFQAYINRFLAIPGPDQLDTRFVSIASMSM